MLEGYDLACLGHNSADYLHLWLETAKLAHADKEKYYGDPDFVYVPRQGLLSKGYAKLRRRLLDWVKASLELLPGDPFPFDSHPEKRPSNLSLAPVEPGLKDDGTTGVRAVDSHGTIFSSTPSGGWPASSPIVPGLGFCLGSRVQMFYLEEGLAKSLAPGKQPSTSLTPSLVMKAGRPWMGFGMPGGDQQDQGTLQFFLNVVDFDMALQDALDAPKVWTRHFPGLFYPHRADPGRAYLEGWLTNLEEIAADLRQRGAQDHGGQSLEWGQHYGSNDRSQDGHAGGSHQSSYGGQHGVGLVAQPCALMKNLSFFFSSLLAPRFGCLDSPACFRFKARLSTYAAAAQPLARASGFLNVLINGRLGGASSQ